MTKIQIQKIFDNTPIAGTKSYQELTPFFDFFNQMLDNFTRALRNGVSVIDNLDAQILTIVLQHDTPLSIKTNKVPIEVRCAKSGMPLSTPLFWEQSLSAANQVTVTALYLIPADKDGIPTKSQVTLIASFS